MVNDLGYKHCGEILKACECYLSASWLSDRSVSTSNNVCERSLLRQMKVCFNALKNCYETSINKGQILFWPL